MDTDKGGSPALASVSASISDDPLGFSGENGGVEFGEGFGGDGHG